MSASQHVRRRRRQKRRTAAAGGSGVLRLGGAGLAILIALTTLTAAGAAAFGYERYSQYTASVAPAPSLIAELPRGGARIYDRHGTLLYEFVDERAGIRRTVSLEDVSSWAVAATVATEDASYWENNGLNVRGLARAAWENFSPVEGELLAGSGGSSITQQLAKNLYIPREERSERSVERKLKEAAIALELTRRYSKEQILEWYLNSISYGGVYVGIEAAARGYFGKPASLLSLAEAALLAGIPQSPAQYNPVEHPLLAKARQQEVLRLMTRQGMISASQAAEAADTELTYASQRFQIEAPHFVLGRVADEIEARFGPRALFDDGLEVYTTLDLGLQHEAERILESWILEFEQQSGGHNGAMLAMDHRSGEVLVYVGSRDYFRDDIEGRNDNVVGLNSPGSTLKPFTYMTAFMRGWSTGTAILDIPTTIKDPATGDDFTPRNPGTGYQGVITASEALGNSLNIPALRAILFAGVDETVATLRTVGFTSLDNPLGYGPALTLGGVDVRLEDLVYGYSVLAADGTMRGQEVTTPYNEGERELEPIALLRVVDADGQLLLGGTEPAERQVIAPSFAGLVTSILSDGSNQCITFGVCGALSLPGRSSAAKTGTSEPFEESRAIGETWAVGYTPQLVAGVWFGNANNEPMVNIVSTSVSWRTWRDFMTMAHEQLELPPAPFERPPTVVSRELCWPSGKLPGEHCPDVNRYGGLFAQEVLDRESGSPGAAVWDDWWRPVALDIRTGLLASEATPPQYVTHEVRLAPPGLGAIDSDSSLGAWLGESGGSEYVAPTLTSDEVRSYIRIASPGPREQVGGMVPVFGSAESPAMLRYVLEWRAAGDGGGWRGAGSSSQPVTSEAGFLGMFDTTALPDGAYDLRLTLDDEVFGTVRQTITVVVQNARARRATGADKRAARGAVDPRAHIECRGAGRWTDRVGRGGEDAMEDGERGLGKCSAGHAAAYGYPGRPDAPHGYLLGVRRCDGLALPLV